MTVRETLLGQIRLLFNGSPLWYAYPIVVLFRRLLSFGRRIVCMAIGKGLTGIAHPSADSYASGPIGHGWTIKGDMGRT